MTWPNGVKYEGKFTDGLCSSVGSYTFPNEEVEQNHNSQLDCKIGSSPAPDSSKEMANASSKSQ